mmetsp:Transcript_32311/g.75460  ORF Transcript_32311/g.75460 Transcript_32311/m.75460 type:complete len:225 (-) Transcript_32311:3-677(-)
MSQSLEWPAVSPPARSPTSMPSLSRLPGTFLGVVSTEHQKLLAACASRTSSQSRRDTLGFLSPRRLRILHRASQARRTLCSLHRRLHKMSRKPATVPPRLLMRSCWSPAVEQSPLRTFWPSPVGLRRLWGHPQFQAKTSSFRPDVCSEKAPRFRAASWTSLQLPERQQTRFPARACSHRLQEAGRPTFSRMLSLHAPGRGPTSSRRRGRLQPRCRTRGFLFQAA